MINTESLKRALDLQEQIEKLQAERDALLGDIQSEAGEGAESAAPVAAPAPKVRRTRGPGRKKGSTNKAKAAPKAAAKKAAAAPAVDGKKAPAKISARRPPFAGKKRPASPSGPLAPAVVKVLKRLGRPAKVGEIYDELLKDKYVFTSSSPKTSLNARIYRLKGVKTLGEGKFTLG